MKTDRHCGGFWGVAAVLGAVIAVTFVTVITVYWTAQELYERRRR